MVARGFFPTEKKDINFKVKHYRLLPTVVRKSAFTVESLLTDTPNKGHCIKYLSTMDKTKSPNFNPPINIMQLESLKRGKSLYLSGQTT